MMKARKIVLARNFEGEPRLEDFRIEEEQLPPLKDGQILAEALYISVDPYQRGYTDIHRVSDTMIGSQVARIVESRAPGFPVGKYVVGYWGWRDRTVADVGPGAEYIMSPVMVMPDFGDLPLSLSLGVLGMPGISAYFGLLDITHPKPGEIVVVSGAAGAVGSLVGQIARIHGCKVIGFAGSDAKAKWLRDDLGFDHAFNYKKVDVAEAIRKVAPDGVDIYFDNVGGEQSSSIISTMRQGGRISVCGAISTYNAEGTPKASFNYHHFLKNVLQMQAFGYVRWHDRWNEGISQLMQWIREGKLKYRETVTESFENTAKAFIGMLRGENFGKSVVRV